MTVGCVIRGRIRWETTFRATSRRPLWLLRVPPVVVLCLLLAAVVEETHGFFWHSSTPSSTRAALSSFIWASKEEGELSRQEKEGKVQVERERIEQLIQQVQQEQILHQMQRQILQLQSYQQALRHMKTQVEFEQNKNQKEYEILQQLRSLQEEYSETVQKRKDIEKEIYQQVVEGKFRVDHEQQTVDPSLDMIVIQNLKTAIQGKDSLEMERRLVEAQAQLKLLQTAKDSFLRDRAKLYTQKPIQGQKYASMTNVQDQAFHILKDLGMVEETPNPFSSDYDDSRDDEIVIGTTFTR